MMLDTFGACLCPLTNSGCWSEGKSVSNYACRESWDTPFLYGFTEECPLWGGNQTRIGRPTRKKVLEATGIDGTHGPPPFSIRIKHNAIDALACIKMVCQCRKAHQG
jgi:hypothetical protein